MRLTSLIAIALLIASAAWAQQAGPTPSANQQQLLTQLHQVGCTAEENAAANTIDQLQKENADLKKQIEKLDPPKKK